MTHEREHDAPEGIKVTVQSKSTVSQGREQREGCHEEGQVHVHEHRHEGNMQQIPPVVA